MSLMKIIRKKDIFLYLLPRLSNFHQKARSFRLPYFPVGVIRLNHSSSSQTEMFFKSKHGRYTSIFKKQKFDINDDIVGMLSEIFETDDQKFKKAITYQKELEKYSESHLRDTSLYLQSLNFSAEHIILSPWILSLTKEDVERKTSFLKQPHLFETIRDGLGFCIFDPELITLYNNKFENEKKEFDPFRNRIYYIANRLNIPVDFLALKVVPALFLIYHVKKEKLDAVIDLIHEFKYKPLDILSDVQVLRSNPNTARERILKYKEAQNSLPKFWVWRSSDFNYERTYSRAKKYGKYYSDDLVEVIKEELHLNEEDSLDLINKYNLSQIQPRMLKYKISKLKEKGLSDENLIKNCFILLKGEKRIRKRIDLMKEKGVFSDRKLPLLGVSDKRFNQRILNLEIKKT